MTPKRISFNYFRKTNFQKVESLSILLLGSKEYNYGRAQQHRTVRSQHARYNHIPLFRWREIYQRQETFYLN